MSAKESGFRLGHSVDEVTINGVDISGVVFGIQLFEGITDGFVEANLLIVDGGSLIHEIDMTRLNDVIIEFSEITGADDEPPKSYRKTFTLNTIKDYGRSPEQDTDTFTIHCLSRSTIINEKISISRSYVTKTISSIVTEMLNVLEYQGTRDITDTAYKRDYVAPRISPIDVIELMRRYAVQAQGDVGNFVFYEDIDGVHFKPLSTIIDVDPVRKYRLVSRNIESADTDFTIPVGNVNIRKVTDIFQDFYVSADETRICFFDIETGSQRIVEISTRDGMVNSNNTRDVGLPDSKDQVITVHDSGFYKSSKQQHIPVIGKNIVGNARTHRMFATIELPGENVIKPGVLIELEHANQTLNEKNPVYSGIWMVERLKRIITSTGYAIHADIISDKIIGE